MHVNRLFVAACLSLLGTAFFDAEARAGQVVVKGAYNAAGTAFAYTDVQYQLIYTDQTGAAVTGPVTALPTYNTAITFPHGAGWPNYQVTFKLINKNNNAQTATYSLHGGQNSTVFAIIPAT